MRQRLVGWAAVSCLYALTIAFGSVAMAEQTVAVTLKDGSTIWGNLLETRDNKLLIHTQSMGPVSVDLGNVMQMVTQSGPASQTSSDTSSTSAFGAAEQQVSMDDVTNRLMSDPSVFNEIMALVDDPELLKLALDPELQAAISSGDVNAAGQHANIQRLLLHPKIRAIMDRLSK